MILRKNHAKMINNIKLKAKIVFIIRDFIRMLPYHILVMGSVFIIATIFGHKYLEAICFLTAFFSLRYKFNTTYHSDNIVICMTMTISIFSLSIIICKPIAMYALFSIFVAYIDCLILWFIKDWQDKKMFYDSHYKEKLYSMNEEELKKYGESKGLTEIQQTILVERIKNFSTINALCNKYCYGRTTIYYHIDKIKRKLGLKSL